jgi:predicted P-loop ATPase
MWLNDNGFLHTQKGTVVDAVAKACSEQSFNVAKDYLEYCQRNTESDDQLLSQWMEQFLGVEPENQKQDQYVQAVSRLSLIQAVARVFNPGCKADSVIILEGQQGTGKSTCLSVLFSPDYFGDQLPPMTSKDASSYLKGKWCIELGELEYKRKAEVETIKAFISRTHEDYRPAFGREEIIHPRTCVFWGTTNKEEYLNDETGNRRFLSIKTNVIDLEGLEDARDALWGAAVRAYLSGEVYWLTGDLCQIAATEAEGRMEQDPWCELILAKMQGMEEASIRDAFFQCFNDESEANRSTADNRRMAKALVLCGWERAGKFTSGNKRNQVKFKNSPPHALSF